MPHLRDNALSREVIMWSLLLCRCILVDSPFYNIVEQYLFCVIYK